MVRSRVLETLVLGLLALLCSGIVASFLYQKARPFDTSQHPQFSATAAQLTAADAQWNEHLLKARLYLTDSYLDLDRSATAMTTLSRRLDGVMAPLATIDETLRDALAGVHASIAEKTATVNRFKQQNTLLRESLDSVSHSIGAVLDAIEADRQVPPAPAKLAELEHHLHEMLAGFLAFSTKPQQRTAELLRREIEEIQQLSLSAGPSLSEAVEQRLAVALAHVETILQRKPAVDTLASTIVTLPTTASFESVQTAYNAAYEQYSSQADTYLLLLYAFLALLGVCASYLLIRWRNKSRMRALQMANETLEQRVTARTQELSGAYEELKRSQMLLVQSEKMSALGQMVAGVAHEINTPLAYSRSNAELVREHLPQLATLVHHIAGQAVWLSNPESTSLTKVRDKLAPVVGVAEELRRDGTIDEMRELLQAVGSGLEQISDMVLNLKNFSRLDRRKTALVSVNDGLDSALMIARNTLKHKVEVVRKYGAVPSVMCAPSQINQVFLNLLINASQAIAEQGRIILTTRASGDHVQVFVEDTGCGIAPEVLPRIFDPFFTTKGVGEGTGLGLAISYQIIEQHSGIITVESKLGQGTRFTISLPLKPVEQTRDSESRAQSNDASPDVGDSVAA